MTDLGSNLSSTTVAPWLWASHFTLFVSHFDHPQHGVTPGRDVGRTQGEHPCKIHGTGLTHSEHMINGGT